MTPKSSLPPVRRQFGQFEADVSSGELRKNGLRIHVQEQQCRILAALLERPGELVTREELRERLWPGDTFVDFERSLNAAVAKLRQVLSDSAEQPRFIETEARRGYRFIAPVAAIPVAAEAGDLQPPSTADETGGPMPGRKRKQLVRPAAAALLLLVLLASAGAYLANRKQVDDNYPALTRFVLAAPEGTRIHPVSAVSPDGRTVAFVAIDGAGHRSLWVQALANETALRLENTDGALAPFFSPDSREIGFFTDGKLKRIPAQGGPPQTVCNQSQAAGGTWNKGGVILFSQAGRLHRVSAIGGIATELKAPDMKPGQRLIDTWPQFLPDGDTFVFRSRTYDGHLYPVRSEILLGSLHSGKRRFLLTSLNHAAITSSGYLFFVSKGILLAQRLDLGRAQLIGEQRVVAEDLATGNEGIFVDVNPGMSSAMGPAAFSVSNSGVLVYHSDAPQRNLLVWYDRNGTRLGVAGEPREYTQVIVSPNERWAAVGIRNRERKGIADQTLWLMSLDTNVMTRLSYGGGQDADPVWSPDSTRIVYGSYEADQGEKIDLLEVKLGERTPVVFYADGRANKPEAWSPNGQFLLFRRDEQRVFRLPTSGNRIPTTLLDTPNTRGRFQFSPDGLWLAYMSSESGDMEIYVSRFPEMTGTRQVSAGGGCTPVWRKDGKELFYNTQNGRIMSLGIKAGINLETTPPKVLFQPNIRKQSYCMGPYGVTANGQKILVIENTGSTRMHIMSRWESTGIREKP